MKKEINAYHFTKISSRMAKEFGRIKKGLEANYSMVLFSMEGNVLKTSRLSNKKSGHDVINAIHVCLFIIDGYITDCEYDLEKYITEDNDVFIHALLMSFDPFTNDDVLAVMHESYDLETPEGLREYFKVPVMCLLRIEESIELWMKQQGTNAYITFLENNIGKNVEHDGQLSFAVKASESQFLQV